VESYITYLNYLRSQFPQSIQDKLSYFEEREDYQNPEYEQLMFEVIYKKHLCRLDPWPECVTRAFSHLNTKVYQTVQGPNEFVVTGNFKDWNRWNDLYQIKIPTLVIGGRFDTMSPADVERMSQLIPNSTLKMCEAGSHLSMYDDQDVYFKTLHDFINKVENR
jgi:proline iminopeptidase